MPRRLVLSLAALSLAVLVLAASVDHVHEHGQRTDCTLCQPAQAPELLDVGAFFQAPLRIARKASPTPVRVVLTLVEVDSSISFRGPPA